MFSQEFLTASAWCKKLVQITFYFLVSLDSGILITPEPSTKETPFLCITFKVISKFGADLPFTIT